VGEKVSKKYEGRRQKAEGRRQKAEGRFWIGVYMPVTKTFSLEKRSFRPSISAEPVSQTEPDASSIARSGFL
jgi:hypothetical protein